MWLFSHTRCPIDTLRFPRREGAINDADFEYFKSRAVGAQASLPVR